MSDFNHNISYSPHPLIPTANRQFFDIALADNTLQALLDQLPPECQHLDILVYVNDELVPRANWGEKLLTQTDVIAIKQRMHGGDSNPLQIIATIALIVFAAWAGPAAYPAAAGATGVTTGAAVLTATIMVTGTLLINAIFPPVIPSVGDDDGSNQYKLTGGRNRARIRSPLPLVVGTHRVHPDLGAQPYSSQLKDDAYLHQVFNFGFGDLQIDDIKIGQTAILDHQDIKYEISDGSTTLELFPTNVDSLAGGELTFENSWIVRTTNLNVTKLVWDLAGILFTINTKGEVISNQFYYQIQYRAVGDVDWIGVDTASTFIKTFFPDLDIAGGESAMSVDKTAPFRRSYSLDVPEGQYETRIRQSRPDPRAKNYTRTKQMSFTQLRSYQPDLGDYSNQTRMAVEVRASGQFTGSLDTVNAIVSARIPYYDFDTELWTTGVTSNPAWIYLYLCRGDSDVNGRRLWGARLPDSRIDINGIVEWASWCEDHQLECNFVFDQKMSVADMLALVARTGRASPTWQKGVLGVVYDREALPITQVFGMSNIVNGSFTVDYITENLADEVVVKFINKDLDYQPDEVRVVVPNVVTPLSPVDVEIAGITSVQQAGREANLIAARQYYNRRRVSFETDIEGLVCGRGDVISMSHDLTDWAISGRLISGTATVLNLTREVTFQPATSYWVGVRIPDGTYHISSVVNPAGGTPVVTKTITLNLPLPINPNTDPNNHPRDYLFFFDPKATPGKKFKVTLIQPVAENRITIAAVDEVAEYYAAEDGVFGYTPPDRFNLVRSKVENIVIGETYTGYDKPLRISLSWDLVQAQGVKIRLSINGSPYEELIEVRGTTYSFDLTRWADNDQLDFEFTPIATGAIREAVVIANSTYFIGGLREVVPGITIPPVTGLELYGQGLLNQFTGRDAKFVWRRVGFEPPEFGNENLGAEEGTFDDIFEDYEIRMFGPNGELRRVDHTSIEEYWYTFEKNSEDGAGAVVRQFTIAVYIRTKTNQVGPPTALMVSNPAPAAPATVSVSSLQKTLNVTIPTPQDLDFQGIVVHVSDIPGFIPGPTNMEFKGSGVNASMVLDYTFNSPFYIRVAGYDGFDDTNLNFSAQIQHEFEGLVIEEIAAGAINDPDMFATDLRPVEVLAELPLVGNFEGRMVFLTTDGKVYRFHDGDWTAAVAAPDLTGTLVASQIADGTLTIDKFFDGLRPIETVAVLPLLPDVNYPDGSVVALTTDGKLYRSYGGGWTSAVPSADIDGVLTSSQIDTILASQITGQIVGTQITDGAITTEKLEANSITANELAVNSVTASAILAGEITTDKMSANSIDGDRITANTLDADKITANSITSAQIETGSIVADSLGVNSVIAEKILAGAITTDKMTANSIDGDRITANTLDADKITANSITAGQIQAGAIGADEIAARAIAAEKLLIGNFTNLVQNFNFASGDKAGWTTWLGTSDVVDLTHPTIPAGTPSAFALRFTNDGSNGARVFTGTSAYSQPGAVDAAIPCEPGQSYFFSCWFARSVTATVNSQVTVYFHRADGTFNNSLALLAVEAATTSWVKRSGTFTVPSGGSPIVAMSLYVRAENMGAGAELFNTNNRLTLMYQGELVVDGSIQASKIATGELTADVTMTGTLEVGGNGYIRSGQTNYNTGNGFWLGRDAGATKFSIGNPLGNYLTYDSGTGVLTISGSITLTNNISYTQVTGLGDLALLDDVNYGDVIGPKPHPDADVTLSVINGSLTIIGGGLVLNGASPRIASQVGANPIATYANNQAGFFLGQDGSVPKFRVGSSTNFMRWTGSVLETTGLRVQGGLIIDTPLEKTAMKIHTGGGRLAPFSIVDYAMVGTGTGTDTTANRIVEVNGFQSFTNGSGWHPKRFAWGRMDVMCEAHIMAGGGWETFEFQRRYNGGSWIGVFQHQWNASNRGSFSGIWRFTTQDNWNTVDFRIITTQSRTLTATLRITVPNVGFSINGQNSFTGVSSTSGGTGGGGGGGPGGTWNLDLV